MSTELTKSIKCDNCNKELLTESPYPHNYNFELSIIDTNTNTSGPQYAGILTPPFYGEKHFCSKECIVEWISK